MKWCPDSSQWCIDSPPPPPPPLPHGSLAVYSLSIILWWADSFIARSWWNWGEAAACRRTEHQRDTSFFYSLAGLSKSHIFLSLFSSAFFQVIGHFSASSRLVGCLLPWPDPCCGCNRGQHIYRFTGGFSTQPPSLRAFLKDQGTVLKYTSQLRSEPLHPG